MSKVEYEGWMVRYGRRKIGRSFMHMRYFIVEHRLLAYYKKKPQDNMVPHKTLLFDGNFRVEDRGLKTQHGHVPGSTHYSMIFYFVTKELIPGSVLQHFVDGDDDCRKKTETYPCSSEGSCFQNQASCLYFFSVTWAMLVLAVSIPKQGLVDCASKCWKHHVFAGESC